jgi:hypothetical protein
LGMAVLSRAAQGRGKQGVQHMGRFGDDCWAAMDRSAWACPK